MNLRNQEDLDKIIHEMDIDHIPAEFVKSAKIVYLGGEVQFISPEELEDFVTDEINPEELGIKNIGLVLDVERIKKTIRVYSELVLGDIPF